MGDFITTNIAPAITNIFGTVGEAVSTITNNNLLLLGVSFWFAGGAIGIMGRLLKRG